MKTENKKDINKLKKKTLIQITTISIVASILSIIFGTLLGLIDFDYSNLNLILRCLIWIANVMISYSISFLFFKIFKFRPKFFNLTTIF